MIVRTTKVISTTNDVIYESTCTIDGNVITGCQDPFPYIRRMLRKRGLRPVQMLEEGRNVTLIVKPNA